MLPRLLPLALCVLCCVSSHISAQDLVTPTIKLDPQMEAKCLKVLRDGMKSEEFWPSIHAAEGLTLAGHGDEVIAALEPKLPKEKDDQKRCGLARELVRAGERKYAQVMLDILAGDDDYGHVHAAESLFKVNEIGDGKAMGAALQQTENVKLRLMAAAALARKGHRDGLEFVRETLSSDNSEESRTAAWVLGRVGTFKDVPALKALASEAKDPLTKAYYQHSLAALGDEEGLAALKKNLSHADEAVRTYAATFAGDAQATDCMADLVKMLNDRHEDARIRAAQTLLYLANPDRPHN